MADEHILVVDDEPRFVKLVRFNLEAGGYKVDSAGLAQEAIEVFSRNKYDLILLDVMLPDGSGFDVCEQIREVSAVPIILLTALTSEDDIVQGLRAGADDYVPKPFSANELIARIEAVLRRTRLPTDRDGPPMIHHGALSVDLLSRDVSKNGEKISLSPTEFQVTKHLFLNQGKAITQDQLLGAVWGRGYERDYDLVRVTIWRLRRKLEDDPSNPTFIVTIPGAGYLVP